MSNLHHALTWDWVHTTLLQSKDQSKAEGKVWWKLLLCCIMYNQDDGITTYQTSVWVCGSHMDNILCWGITGNQSMILLLWICPTRKQEMAYIPGRIPVTNEIHFQTCVMYVTNKMQSFWAFQSALHELHLGQFRTEIKYHFKHLIAPHRSTEPSAKGGGHTVALSLLLRVGATP